MQVRSTKAKVSGSSLQQAGHAEISKTPVAAVTRREEPNRDVSQYQPSPALEGKLHRIREVQQAFMLALRATQSMESKYLFDPIF
jgi:hypothetical protein